MTSGYEFGGPGGVERDEKAFQEDSIRADLCEIATLISYQYGAKIVNAILSQYDVKPKTKKFSRGLSSPS